MIDDDDRKRMLRNWRGRRLLACRTTDQMEEIINSLGAEDGSELPPSDGDLPKISESQRNELRNLSSLLLRMILVANDDRISTATLRRW